MWNMRRAFPLLIVAMLAVLSLSAMTGRPVFAQSSFSPTPTPYEQDLSYTFPDGYTFVYEITQEVNGYAIASLVMDNPYPIKFSFYEKLLNGATNQVTDIVQIGHYGTFALSTSYPMNITLTELNNQPTSTSQTPIPTQTPAETFTESPSLTPSITPTLTAGNSYPSISFLLITNAVALIVIAILLAVIIALLLLMRHRKNANMKR